MIIFDDLQEWNQRPVREIELHLANLVSLLIPEAHSIYENGYGVLHDSYGDDIIFANDDLSYTFIEKVNGVMTDPSAPYKLRIKPIKYMTDGGGLRTEDKLFLVRLAEQIVDDNAEWVLIKHDGEELYVVDDRERVAIIGPMNLFTFRHHLIDGWGLSYEYISTFQPTCLCDSRAITYRESSGWYCKNCYGKIPRGEE